ncbi:MULTISPECIES: HEAT repeat domain-containing protein [Haloferax]|uniref:HEAT repeat domain-containing protein n=2 Tax=Haloferax TaxID=2251 RepID=A0A6G1Z652_9EURY|nr:MULTISPECIES: HEAT repeat domain-containing protein [Haloferax]KAB1185346.1 HEAT repeat domain-containing protein [Haloferax sp. CBA1149]MRW81983.1 HEAT repeat domain-containing protein [Haloferax marinisediminis]
MLDAGETPLEDVQPGSVQPSKVDTAEVKAALSSADPIVRQRACSVCEGLAGRDVDSLLPLIHDIGARLHDDSTAVVQAALSVLTDVAATEPTMLESCLSDLVSVTQSELSGITLGGARCLAALTAEHPRACVPHVGTLVESILNVEVLEDVDTFTDTVTDPTTRQTIREHQQSEQRDLETARRLLSHVVAACAQTAPTELHEEIPLLTKLLSDEDPVVIGAGLTALSAVAQDDPTVIAVDDTLLDCLDHDDRRVRAHAIETVGFLGADSIVPTLQRMAEADPDEDVAALAAATAEFLEA